MVRLVIDKMDVSISLGLWTIRLVYLVSIPLGTTKAVRDGSPFEAWTSAASDERYATRSADCGATESATTGGSYAGSKTHGSSYRYSASVI